MVLPSGSGLSYSVVMRVSGRLSVVKGIDRAHNSGVTNHEICNTRCGSGTRLVDERDILQENNKVAQEHADMDFGSLDCPAEPISNDQTSNHIHETTIIDLYLSIAEVIILWCPMPLVILGCDQTQSCQTFSQRSIVFT